MNKKLYTICTIAAAFVLAGCQKENNEEATTYVGPTHTVTFTAEKMIDTKTAIDTEGNGVVSYKWIEGDEERMHITESYTDGENTVKNGTTSIAMALSNDDKVATFTVTFTGNAPEGEVTYDAFYAGSVSNSGNPLIPASQNPLQNSFDPAADVLVADPIVKQARDASPTFKFNMTRKVSVNKLTLKGLTPNETISTVTFESDKQHSAYYVPGTDNYSPNSTKLTFTFTANNTVPASGEFPVYFTTAPVTDATFTVKVITNAAVYEKTGANTISFAVGSVRRFGMSYLPEHRTPITAGTVYTLVESNSDIVDGADYLIVGSYNSVYKAMSEQRTNNRNASEELTVDNNTITIDSSSEAHIFTLFNYGDDGFVFQDQSDNMYLYGDGANGNYLKCDASINASSYWTIDVDSSSHHAIITNNNDANSAKPYLKYNHSGLFSSYGSSSTGTHYVYLYISTTSGGKHNSGLSFTTPSYSFVLGDANYTNFTGQTLNNPNSLTGITWASDNTNLATVSNGTVSLVANATGTATITASFAGNGTYKAGSASYTITVNPAAGHGESEDDPFSVSEALTFVNGLSSTPTADEYYVSGIISRIAANGEFGTQYGNATFYISDDGSSSSDEFEAYRVLYLGNRKWKNGDMQIAVGDEVIVCGRLTIHNDQVETLAQTGDNAYNGYLVSLEKAPYFNASLSSDSIAAEGGTITLTIDSNTSWTVAINGSTGAAAASLSANSGSNSGTITVTIPQNNDGATYTLSFTAASVSSAPADLTITQHAYVNLVSATATFISGRSGGMAAASSSSTSGTRRNVTASISAGGDNTQYSNIQVYKNGTLTLSVPSGAYITAIAFYGTSSNPVSNFGSPAGLTIDGDNGSWTGSAQSVTFTASVAQVRLTKIAVTYSIAADDLITDAPEISVTSNNPMSVSNTAGSESITYTIYDAPDGAVLTSVNNSASWITNIDYSTSGTVSFNVAAQATGAAARSANLVLKYTGAADVTVTVNQAAGPSQGGGSYQASGTLASWVFSSTSYPSNKTNFTATSGICAQSTFYLNGTGSTWNTQKGYAFTAVTDVTITIKAVNPLKAGSSLTLSMDTFYNKESNAPMKGFTIKASESGGSSSTAGLDVSSWTLSTTSANKSVTYTIQNDIATGNSVVFTLTGTGKEGAGQGFIGNVQAVYTSN